MHRLFGPSTPSSCLALLVLVGSARADENAPRQDRQLALVMVEAQGEAGAPADDAARVRTEAHAQLAAATDDIEGCLREQAPREDPMGHRERRMVVAARFGASGGAERVWVARDSGMPPAVRRCVLEWVRAVEVRPPPGGEVRLRAVFDLR